MGEIGYFFNLIFTYPIFNALMLLYRVLGDFGLSIIVLTLLVKLVLFPLTLQQLKSMKATQALQPQIAEIRKKYPKDQRAVAEATQALYKEYGMHPLAGSCLPLLIQMPVLFGLFYAFSSVLRNATLSSINNIIYPGLPHFSKFPNIDLNWFTFISPALHFSLGLPDPTHVLPILAGLATYVQMRMSQPKTVNTSGTPDAMAQQQKIMQLLSPAMVLFFGWNYAAGLALYWTVSSIFAMFQQYFITGWGSLMVKPDFLSSLGIGGKPASNSSAKSNGKTSYVGDQAKETKLLARANETDGSGPIGTQLRTNTYSNGTSAVRRRSASARRRSSNNIPKRNPSRS